MTKDQEPVAYYCADCSTLAFNPAKGYSWEPLYTHPAPIVSSEPTAWVKKTDTSDFWWLHDPIDEENYYPLYLHPARTLSDEEILEIYGEKADSVTNKYVIEFARAVLEKAK